LKPAPFEYYRAADLDEACALLCMGDGDEARLIAGGQTLVPLMAMRLARPKRLIDIARIPELAFVRKEDSAIAIGATTRQHVLEHDPLVRAEVPLLAMVMPHIGHAPTRARGTLGGSLANADPAAEIALVAVTLEATLAYREGARAIETAAAEFFTGPMTTVLPPTGLLTGARFPIWRHARVGVGFHEVSSRTSDFAFASAAAQIALDEAGICRRAALGIGAVTSVPLRLDRLGEKLENLSFQEVQEKPIREEVAALLSDQDVFSDLHASGDYRRRAAAALLIRAIFDAWRNADQTAVDVIPAERAGLRPANESLNPVISVGRAFTQAVDYWVPARAYPLRDDTIVHLDVNGAARSVEIEPRTSLLDCLREQFLLTGAHAGCEHGVCGACTVLMDGTPIRSCLMFAVQADGHAITTIEGLTPGPGELSIIQDTFCETHGMQCGYCTPAMILAAHALLASNPAPARAEIVRAVSANLCRCTGYAQIIEAIALAAERMRRLNRPATGP
jgi:xanthine dehydrogenase iron-sulfur cluster and FAD-binding subunit A